MASLSHALFLPAVASGLFFAIGTKTGIDISPSGIGLMIFHALEPYVTEQNVGVFRIGEIVLLILPWIFLIGIVIRFGIKGLFAYVVIVIVSYISFLYFWK